MEGINPISIYQQKINMINSRISSRLSAVGIDTGFSEVLKSVQNTQNTTESTNAGNGTDRLTDVNEAVKNLGISSSGVLWNTLLGEDGTDNYSSGNLQNILKNSYGLDLSSEKALKNALLKAYGSDLSSEETLENILYSGSTYKSHSNNGIFDMNDINPNAEIGKRTEYEYLIGKAAEKYGVDEILIKAIMKAESDFNPDCVSGAGAVGLMQLMPGTAELMGVKNSYDPEENINGGVGYFKKQLDAFGGDIKMALAAYNCGPSRLKKLGITSLENVSDFAKLPKETQNYVNKIINSIK